MMLRYPFRPFGFSTKHFCHGKFQLTVFTALALAAAPASLVDACNDIMAKGGQEVYQHGDYCVHEFTGVGSNSFQVKVPEGLDVEYLIVGGGGGGGNLSEWVDSAGGGGGAGGLLSNIDGALETFPYGSHMVVVGAGGQGGQSSRSHGQDGGDSKIGSLIAYGGGGGGGAGVNYAERSGRSGGSGGGGGGGTQGSAGGAAKVPGQGFGGGDANLGAGGGGGGAGASGESGSVNVKTGDGGKGTQNNITGLSVYYCGGGGAGGGRSHQSGSGGSGGGGSGGIPGGAFAESGVDGKGGGGGGGAANQGVNSPGGNGGSGIVIVRYALEKRISVTGSPTISIDAMGIAAGAEPRKGIVNDGARLQWVSIGANDIRARLDPTSSLPPGVKLSVKVGSLTPVQVTESWNKITNSIHGVGDEPVEYIVQLDPVASLAATGQVSVEVEYKIGK